MIRLIGGMLVYTLAVSGCRSPRAPMVRAEPAQQAASVAFEAPANLPQSVNALPAGSERGQVGEAAVGSRGSYIQPTQYVAEEGGAALVNPAALEPLPSPAAQGADGPEPLPATAPEYLTLDDVLTAVYASYPALDAAARERQIAAGYELAAMGAFDTNLSGEAIAEPLGFYENYRSDLGVKNYAWSGAQTFAGYRLGRGSFEPWYLERETNKGGEFRTGVALPFLRDRDIDKRRAEVFRRRIDRTAAEPTVQLEVIDAVRNASLAYWYWVASGQQVRIGQSLLDLASERQSGLRTRAEQGDISEIDLVDNERLIAARQAKLVDAQRKLDQAAIKLSLFLRDPAGTPLLAPESQLPPDFPDARAINTEAEPVLITQALARRPELWLLRLERERAAVDMQQASNLMLPALDGIVSASQDVGEPTSEKRDKSELELEAGARLEVPLQRREARGKLQAAQGKLTQVAAKQRLTEQKIVVEVQNAYTGLAADYEVLQQARRSADLARKMEQAERTRFDQGDSNLLNVNIRESAAAEAEALVVLAAMDYFISQANLRAATGAELAGAP